jgi:hypothetical protein
VRIENEHPQIGRAAIALRTNSETAVDLPTPVVPTMAKWRLSVSSMAMRAWIEASCDRLPDGDRVAPASS